ncbi:MAG: sigma-70 family RNA polymerase sigma factor [Candidatus Aminicenantes bacterium]|nr:sigma-70 family RNA polymerase sigma factor [Candidatus Aminicenantes bacterium]
MNESKAIRLCLVHRDPAGFEFLVKKFKKEALYHAVSFTGNYEDAADICQESFYKAFIAIPKLKKLDRFYPWFYVILKNNCLNLIQHKSRIDKHSNEIHEHSVSTNSGPETFFEKREENENIWRIIKELKSEHREILMMKYAMRKSYEDISITLNIPRGTVMSRLYNARRSFKERYLGELSEFDPGINLGGKNGKK